MECAGLRRKSERTLVENLGLVIGQPEPIKARLGLYIHTCYALGSSAIQEGAIGNAAVQASLNPPTKIVCGDRSAESSCLS